MSSKKIFFIISLLGILSLIFIGNISKEFQYGTIKKIESSNTKTTILLNENEIPLIIFNKIRYLEKGDEIDFYGKVNLYKGQKQIIVDKIKHIKE